MARHNNSIIAGQDDLIEAESARVQGCTARDDSRITKIGNGGKRALTTISYGRFHAYETRHKCAVPKEVNV